MSGLRKVTVAILSWNGRHNLAHCLPALRAQHDPGVEWEVMVLDNGSSDGTREWVAEHHPEVRLVASDANLGFCGGNDRLAELSDADALALLNDDTRPERDWLGNLVAALADADRDVAAVSGRIVDWAGERLDFASGVMTFDGHAFQRGFGTPLPASEVTPRAGTELLFACGGNMLVRRRSFLEAGGFDADYFAYLEDVDLGWRLWSGGERVIFAPDAVVHHRSMASSDHLGHWNRGFLFERNAYLTAYKNFDHELWPRIMPAVLLTLIHRTQTLLVQNNPGGEQLTFDPYAGLIANTRRPPSSGGAPPLAPPPPRPGLLDKVRAHGTREMARRGFRKLLRRVTPWVFSEDPSWVPRLTDGRTVAQLRALTWVLGNLDAAAASRRRVQERRRRPDREIFERFPLWIVPTYPGDERLFASPSFAAWMPDDLPYERRRLDEVMSR